jgi:hypothetical protein
MEDWPTNEGCRLSTSCILVAQNKDCEAIGEQLGGVYRRI